MALAHIQPLEGWMDAFKQHDLGLGLSTTLTHSCVMQSNIVHKGLVMHGWCSPSVQAEIFYHNIDGLH